MARAGLERPAALAGFDRFGRSAIWMVWRAAFLVTAAAPSLARAGGGGAVGTFPSGGWQEEVVSVKPLIIVFRNFASPTECRSILELIERCHRDPSDICSGRQSRLNKDGNQSVAGKQLRNSTSFTLELPGELDPAVDELLQRAHLAARHPITYGEGIQVADYHPGNYYQFHHDAMRRRATFLVYLTEVPEGDGGETIFPMIRRPGVPADQPPPLPPAVTLAANGTDKVLEMEEMTPYCESDFYLKVRPQQGLGVLFYGYRPDASRELHAIHGSCPLKRGHKALWQRWMRFEENALYARVAREDESLRRRRAEWGGERLIVPRREEPPPDALDGAPGEDPPRAGS